MNLIIYWTLFIVLFFWLCVLTFILYRYIAHYNNLIEKGGKESLRKILENILNSGKLSQEKITGLEKKLINIETEGMTHIQKVGILRFNPFEDTGGDQSFIMALLDGNNSGIVLTSLHSRGVTRWYAKNVNEGRGTKHELSKDENEAIKNASKLKINYEKQ